MAELRVRASATKAITRLMTKLQDGKLTELEIPMQRVTLQNLEGHYQRFMEAHLFLVGSAQDAEVDAHTVLFEEVEDKYTNVKAVLMAAIDTAAQERPPSCASVARSVRGQRGDDVRLEKIVIPEFHGEFNRWIGFRDMFEAMVHSQEHLSTAAKYTRLMKALKGTAAQVVAGFLPTDDNYESAWKTLKARYDNDRLIVSAHLNIFLNMPSLEKETNVCLRRVIDITNETTRSLAAMKRPVDKWDDILVHILVSKLPKATVIHWEMEQRGTDLPKLTDLLDFIEGRARGLDHMGCAMAERTTNVSSTVNKRHSSNPRAYMGTGGLPRLTRSNLPTADRGHCYYCNGDHYIGRCPTLLALPPSERFGKVKDSNLCYNCLTPGHATRACLSKRRCAKCHGVHHTVLCRTVTTDAEASSGKTATTSAAA